MRKYYRKCLSVAFSLVFCLLFGCDNKQKLTGTVVFSDGAPLTTGTVIFSSGTFLSRAYIKPNGSFDVGSLKDHDGIPPGKYKVYISDAFEAVPDPKNPEKELMKPFVDAKYTARETTPLEVEIPGLNVFHVVVERP